MKDADPLPWVAGFMIGFAAFAVLLFLTDGVRKENVARAILERRKELVAIFDNAALSEGQRGVLVQSLLRGDK